MAKQVIVGINAGCQAPVEHLKKVFEAHNKAFGAAAIIDGSMQIARFTGEMEFKDIQDVLGDEALKGATTLLCFSDTAPEREDEEAQPYAVLKHPTNKHKDGDGSEHPEIMIACAIAGDCPGYRNAEAHHSDQWFVAKTYLQPKLSKEANASKWSLADLVKELKDTVFGKDIGNVFTGPGTVAIITGHGDLVTYGKNTEFAAYDWGFTSSRMGMEAPKEKPTEEEKPEEKKKPKFAFMRGKSDDKEPAKQVEPPKTETAQPVTAGATLSDETKLRVRPPKTLNTKEQYGNFYDRLSTVGRPNGYKKGPALEFTVGQLKDYSIEKLKTMGCEVTVLGAPLPKEMPTQPGSEPIVPAEEVEKHEEFKTDPKVTEAIKAHADVIKDPAKYAEYNKKWPTFEEKSGTSLSELHGMPYPILLRMVREQPNLAALAIMNLVGPEEEEDKVAPKVEEQPKKKFAFQSSKKAM